MGHPVPFGSDNGSRFLIQTLIEFVSQIRLEAPIHGYHIVRPTHASKTAPHHDHRLDQRPMRSRCSARITSRLRTRPKCECATVMNEDAGRGKVPYGGVGPPCRR